MDPAAARLLAPLALDAQQRYYEELQARGLGPGVVVRETPDGRGKGLYAARAFEAGEAVLTEPPLVAMQHTENRPEALVCGRCFRFVGSLSLQIARRLLTGGMEESTVMSLLAALPQCDTAVPLPRLVPCPGGCTEEAYCSHGCALGAWREHHALLCVGPGGREAGGPLAAFKMHADETNDVFHLAAQALVWTAMRADRLSGGAGPPEPPLGGSASEDAGAAGSSRPAAAAGPVAGPAASFVLSGVALPGGGLPLPPGAPPPLPPPPSPLLSPEQALDVAWTPLRSAHKPIWWEAVSVPDDATEADFRAQLRDLAGDSLALLRRALPGPAARYPGLFSVEVYGSLVGMVECNNLSLVVPSPLGDYWAYLEDNQLPGGPVPAPEHAAALRAAQVLQAALGGEEGWDAPAEGTGFYALQSCANHSCRPTARAAKGPDDVDGAAVLLADSAIAPGEEITICYVDEEESYEDRAAGLAEYGFTCGCARCTQEALDGLMAA